MQAWLLEAETFDTGHVPRAMLQLAGPVKVPICRNCYSEIKKRAENPVNGNCQKAVSLMKCASQIDIRS